MRMRWPPSLASNCQTEFWPIGSPSPDPDTRQHVLTVKEAKKVRGAWLWVARIRAASEALSYATTKLGIAFLPIRSALIFPEAVIAEAIIVMLCYKKNQSLKLKLADHGQSRHVR